MPTLSVKNDPKIALENFIQLCINKYDAMEKSRNFRDQRNSKVEILKELLRGNFESATQIAENILKLQAENKCGDGKLKTVVDVLATVALFYLNKKTYENTLTALNKFKTLSFSDGLFSSIQQLLSNNSDTKYNFNDAFQNYIVADALRICKLIQLDIRNQVLNKRIANLIEDQKQRINSQQHQIDKLKNLELTVADAKKTESKQHIMIDSLNEVIDEQNEKIEKLEQTIAAQDYELAAQSDFNAELNKMYNDLMAIAIDTQTIATKAEATYTFLQNDYINLQNLHEEVVLENSTLKDQNNFAAEKINTLNEKIADLNLALTAGKKSSSSYSSKGLFGNRALSPIFDVDIPLTSSSESDSDNETELASESDWAHSYSNRV